MRFFLLIVASSILLSAQLGFAAPNLIPPGPNQSPDYFCTWNLQGYVCNYSGSKMLRREVLEQNVFGHGKYQDWIDFYPAIRGNLFLVLDDSWDVPLSGDRRDYGCLILNSERFPSFTGTPAESLRKLNDAIRAKGWRGMGGWVCAQEAPAYANPDEKAYWTERLHWMRDAGVGYWKIDWGSKSRDGAWREMVSKLALQEAPNLVVEQAIAEDSLGSAAVYRTYDVENIIAAPVTIGRISHLLRVAPQGSPTIINCEDEPYIAAGTGSAIGIMRHPFAGPLPNGQQDYAFPPVGRDLKHRLDEVIRGVNWHRIAKPIPLGEQDAVVDTTQLTDTWTLHDRETWMSAHPGDRRTAQAPARIARGGLALPTVEVDDGQPVPYVLVSRSSNGVVAIATIGRTLDRSYVTSQVRVTEDVGHADTIGVFGVLGRLTLHFDRPVGQSQILTQDLAGNESVDITKQVSIEGDSIILDGRLISKIGLSAASKGDISEPGLVIAIKKAAN